MSKRGFCHRKITYLSQEIANLAIELFHGDDKYDRSRLHSYNCPACGQWHVGGMDKYRGKDLVKGD